MSASASFSLSPDPSLVSERLNRKCFCITLAEAALCEARILRSAYVAQDFAAPGERAINLDGMAESRKSDCQFYVYVDEFCSRQPAFIRTKPRTSVCRLEDLRR